MLGRCGEKIGWGVVYDHRREIQSKQKNKNSENETDDAPWKVNVLTADMRLSKCSDASGCRLHLSISHTIKHNTEFIKTKSHEQQHSYVK